MSNSGDDDDADLVPLMRPGADLGDTSSSSANNTQREKPSAAHAAAHVADAIRKQYFLPVLLLASLCLIAFKGLGGSQLFLGGALFGGESKPSISEQIQNLNQRFVAAQQDMFDMLKEDYGEQNFQSMFLQSIDNGEEASAVTTRGRSSFVGGENGWNGMKRKLTIKLLQVLHQEQQPKSNGMDSVSDADHEDRRVTFVWATGGHSAAAGHGNWFNQSYTAYMERAAAPLLSNLGIRLVARNYAVGGASSGPEIALCQVSRFGNDLDVLSWDFGMTDGDYFHRMELYYYRAALAATRPAAIGFPRGEYKQRVEILNALGDLGMTTLYMEEAQLREVLERVPDTLGKSQDELDAMPPFVRNFKCDNRIEEGDPYCDEEKYTLQVCPDRRFKTSWHPGWKWHAVNGNLIALLLVEVVQDALQDLLQAVAKNNELDTVALLANLTSEEAADYHRVAEADLPTYAREYHREANGDVSAPEAQAAAAQALELRHLYYKEPNFCHIALLPSEIRYKGILTETDPVDILDLPNGLLSNKAYDEPVSESETLRLVGDADTRQQCPVPLNQDHQDFFYVSDREGWRHLALPNDAELREYGTQPHTELKGVVAICYVGCPWGECQKGDLHFNNTGAGPVELQINGVPVVSLRAIDPSCHVLENAETGYHWKPNEDGRFRISARVTEEHSYLRFSSFIIW